MTARPDTPTPGSLLWAVSETRRIIGDDGRAMLGDLPAAVEVALDKAFSDGAHAFYKTMCAETGRGSSYYTASMAALAVRRRA